jgi:hypothetical protein
MTGVQNPSNEGSEKNEAQVTFNEQTNYVPKSTIITVSATKAKIAQLLTLA